MPTCETCKWWGRKLMMRGDWTTWRGCGCYKTAKRVSGYPKMHKNFGCIHHQPEEAEDE